MKLNLRNFLHPELVFSYSFHRMLSKNAQIYRICFLFVSCLSIVLRLWSKYRNRIVFICFFIRGSWRKGEKSRNLVKIGIFFRCFPAGREWKVSVSRRSFGLWNGAVARQMIPATYGISTRSFECFYVEVATYRSGPYGSYTPYISPKGWVHLHSPHSGSLLYT